MLYAVKAHGVGEPVELRAIEPDWPLADGETFTTKLDDLAPGAVAVLAEGGESVRVMEAGVRLTIAAARRQLANLLDAATAPILDAYPPAEQLSWDAKEIEAAAFTTAAAAAAVGENAPAPLPADYPMLRGEVAAEQAIAVGDVTLEQLADKVEAVLWMASQWRALISALSGIRKRYITAIDAAEDAAARRAAIEAAQAEIVALTA